MNCSRVRPVTVLKTKTSWSMKNSGSKAYVIGLIGLGILFTGGLIVLIVFLVIRSREKKKLSTGSVQMGTIEERDSKPTNDDQRETFAQIFNAAKSLGYSDEVSKAIAGQSAHETGRWSSELATKYYNIFGMKSGGGGKGIQTGEAKGFATYDSYEDSLRDLDAWLTAKGFNKSEDMQPENYIQWIKSKKYFEDTFQNYRNSVLSLIKELF